MALVNTSSTSTLVAAEASVSPRIASHLDAGVRIERVDAQVRLVTVVALRLVLVTTNACCAEECS